MKINIILFVAFLIGVSAQADGGLDCQGQLLTKIRWKAATWNLNLLDLGFSTSSDYKKRSDGLYPMMLDYLRSDGAPDVLFLQEVWTAQDHETLQRVATDAGYMALAAEGLTGHGLQILVRRSSVREVEPVRFMKFRHRTSFERLYRVQRGLLMTSVTLLNGRTVTLINTHLTPFTDYAHVRRSQIDQTAAFLQEKRQSLVIFGGDLNIAADYAATTSKDRRRLEGSHWLYSYFKSKLQLTDSHSEAKPFLPIFTYNNLFPPLNGIRRSSAEKRLDYIWHANARTVKVGTEFSMPVDGVYPSDHFLYFAVLDL